MSESTLIEIIASPMRTIKNARERKKILGEKIAIRMKEINQNLTRLRLNDSNVNRNYHSISPLLEKARPISIHLGNDTSVLDISKRFAAITHALSKSPELSELHSEVKLKVPYLDNLINETNYYLRTGNITALQSKSREINTQFKKINNVLQKRHSLMEKEEIKATSELIRNSLKETDFTSIKEIRSRSGGIILRATNKESFSSVFAEIDSGHGIKIDTKGFVGNACTDAVDKLLEKLKEKGIDAKKMSKKFHNKSEGGELVKAVEPLFNPIDGDASSPPDFEQIRDQDWLRRRKKFTKKKQRN